MTGSSGAVGVGGKNREVAVVEGEGGCTGGGASPSCQLLVSSHTASV